MEIKIFDVEHGFCAYIVADNGNVMLIDCGHNTLTNFRPSTYLPACGCTAIERLVISNYDEDHMSDLENLLSRVPVQVLHRNRTITGDQLHRLKKASCPGPLGTGTRAVLGMIGTYTMDTQNPPDLTGVELEFFWNSYPLFEDTNNLSLVTFLHYRDLHLVFPGDLEKAGWRALLNDPSFCDHLRKVNVFIASHHGRENGYCPEVFNYCSPEIIAISDEAIKYDTQDVDYAKHARGVSWHDGSRRYVLTTRKHGMITISQSPGMSARIDSVR